MGGQGATAADEIKDGAKSLAQSAKNNPVVEVWMRLGYAVRGLLYGLIGFLAFQLLLTGRGKLTDQTGALAAIAAQPFGDVLLIVIAIGALGYALWGILRAILDPFKVGSGWKGSIMRTAAAITGLSYGAIVIPIINLLAGAREQVGQESQQAQQVASGLFTYPWGPWLVGLIGLVVLGIGLINIYRGLAEKFEKHFEGYRLNQDQRRWAIRMGKIGTMALGVVLATIGILALLAAFTLDPEKVGGIDQALAFLIQQPYGPWLMGLVALGLMAYAAYSLMGAMWFKFKGL